MVDSGEMKIEQNGTKDMYADVLSILFMDDHLYTREIISPEGFLPPAKREDLPSWATVVA